MGPIEAALVILAVSGCWLRYRAVSIEAALVKREEAIPALRELLDDPTVSSEVKSVALRMFASSTDPHLPPMAMLTILVFVVRGGKPMSVLAASIGEEGFERLNKFVRQHLIAVNLRASLVWYLLLALLLAITLLPVLIVIVLLAAGHVNIVKFFKRLWQAVAVGTTDSFAH